jgi:energy-coupling factor transport system permease protein
MLIVWLGVLGPLVLFAGLEREHGRFVAGVVLPIGLALVLIWGYVVGAPPGKEVSSNPEAGRAFAYVITLRLALLGGITQLGLMTIEPENLMRTLRCWGLRGEKLIIAMSALVIWTEVKLRADQILTARYARGLVSKPGLVQRAHQLPYILRPLVAWVLRSSIQRSEVWEQRQLLARADDLAPTAVGSSLVADIFWLTLTISWLAYGLICLARR